MLAVQNRGVVDTINEKKKDFCVVSHRLRSVLSHLACIPAGYFRSGPDFGPANGAGSAFQGKEAPPYLGCIPAGYFRPGPAFCPTHGVGPFFQVELQTLTVVAVFFFANFVRELICRFVANDLFMFRTPNFEAGSVQ